MFMDLMISETAKRPIRINPTGRRVKHPRRDRRRERHNNRASLVPTPRFV